MKPAVQALLAVCQLAIIGGAAVHGIFEGSAPKVIFLSGLIFRMHLLPRPFNGIAGTILLIVSQTAPVGIVVFMVKFFNITSLSVETTQFTALGIGVLFSLLFY